MTLNGSRVILDSKLQALLVEILRGMYPVLFRPLTCNLATLQLSCATIHLPSVELLPVHVAASEVFESSSSFYVACDDLVILQVS